MFHTPRDFDATPHVSRIPEALLAAVFPRLDVELVRRIDRGRVPTRAAETIDIDGRPAVVQADGVVLALISRAQFERDGAGEGWEHLPAPARGAQPLPDPVPSEAVGGAQCAAEAWPGPRYYPPRRRKRRG